MKKTSRRGFTTGAVLLTITIGFLYLGSLMLAASTQINQTGRHMARTRATLIAEAGIDSSLITLTNNWNATTDAGTLYEDPGTNAISAGTYACTITVVDSAHRKVVSVGTEPSGKTATLVAIVNKEDNFISKFAMLANQNININGTVNVATIPVDQHSARVHSNMNISFGSNSVVDGTLSAVGSVTGGSGYYANVPGADMVPFPDAEQIADWRSKWTVEAQSSGRTYVGANIFTGSKTSVTIQAPAWIEGDVSLNGAQKLTFTGDGVVWINGNLRLTANSVLTNGSLLVLNGNMSQAGQSLYQAGASTSATPTLVAFTGDSDVAGGGVAQGVIYSVYGNLKVTGNSAFIGSLIAGMEIQATGTYNQYYPTNQSSRVAFLSPPHVEKLVEL